MRYEIYQNNDLVNVIVCDPSFIDEYCEENKYTYKVVPEVEIPVILEPEPLDPKIQALVDQQTFLEDCIAEMAMIVYE